MFLRRTKFSNRGWRHRQSWFFAKYFSFQEHFSNGERRKLSENFCVSFFVLDLKHVITNVFRKVFFQHNMRTGTSTETYFKTTKFARPHVVKYAVATCTFLTFSLFLPPFLNFVPLNEFGIYMYEWIKIGGGSSTYKMSSHSEIMEVRFYFNLH